MTLTTFVKVHPVFSYYVLAFAISWGAILLVVGSTGLTGTGATIVVSGIVSLTGPSLAGLLMTGIVDGRPGYRRLASRLLRWRVDGRWYAIALLTGPVVMGATVFALSAADPAYLPAIATDDNKLGLLVMGIGSGAFFPIFEEIGWTGFAMPRLLARHGVLATGLLMGVLWGVWHFPFFAGTTDPSGVVPSWLLVAALLFAWLPPYRVLMVWVYERTESLLLAVLMHAPIFAGMYVFADDASGAGLAVKVLAWGAAFWAIALLALWSDSRSLNRAQVAHATRELAA